MLVRSEAGEEAGVTRVRQSAGRGARAGSTREAMVGIHRKSCLKSATKVVH